MVSKTLLQLRNLLKDRLHCQNAHVLRSIYRVERSAKPPLRDKLQNKIMKKLIAIWIMIGSGIAVAAPPQEKSLCRKDERVVFACNLGKKMVSLCASGGGSAKYQYRAGTSQHLELQFPETLSRAEGHFWFSSRPFAGGGSAHIRFKNADYEYILFDYTVRTGFDPNGLNNPQFGSGVAVLQGGNVISMRTCKNDASINSLAYDEMPKEEYKSYDKIPE